MTFFSGEIFRHDTPLEACKLSAILVHSDYHEELNFDLDDYTFYFDDEPVSNQLTFSDIHAEHFDLNKVKKIEIRESPFCLARKEMIKQTGEEWKIYKLTNCEGIHVQSLLELKKTAYFSEQEFDAVTKKIYSFLPFLKDNPTYMHVSVTKLDKSDDKGHTLSAEISIKSDALIQWIGSEQLQLDHFIESVSSPINGSLQCRLNNLPQELLVHIGGFLVRPSFASHAKNYVHVVFHNQPIPKNMINIKEIVSSHKKKPVVDEKKSDGCNIQ